MLLFEESTHYELKHVLIKQLGTFGQSWTTFWTDTVCNGSNRSVWNFAHTLHIQNMNCTWAGIMHYGLCLAFQKLLFFLVLSFTRYNVLYFPTLISYFHKLQSVSFQMLSRICIYLFQVLSYRQLELGMSF
jgi:hypothetical protein